MIFVWPLDSVIFVGVLALLAVGLALFIVLKIAHSIVKRWQNRVKTTRWNNDSNQ